METCSLYHVAKFLGIWYNVSIREGKPNGNKLRVFRRAKVIPMILGEIKRYLRDGNSLRVSRSIRDTAYRILKAREKIEAQDEEATIARIAEELELKEREVVYALDAISDPVSLYDPVYNKSGDALELMDQICDETQSDEI